MASFPWVLIPVYLMPLFFVFHLASLAKLRCEEFRNLALRTQSDYRKILISRLHLSSAIFLLRPCQTEHAAACIGETRLMETAAVEAKTVCQAQNIYIE